MIILSNNQWKCDKNSPDWEAIGADCSAEARAPKLVKAYLEAGADIIGLQENSVRMTELMLPELRKYYFDFISGGDTPIFYRSDKMEVKESGFFRYDEAVPGYPGSFNNAGTKSYSYAVFRMADTQKHLAVLSTHLWYMTGDPKKAPNYYRLYSAEARAYQIGLACKKMDELSEKYQCPAVIMGDFNAAVGSLCLNTAFADGWREAHDIAIGEKAEDAGFHRCNPGGFGRGTDPDASFLRAIDHILIKNGGTVCSFKRFTPEWFDCLSDHYPLYIDFEF